MAKLAGIRKSLGDVLNENVSRRQNQGDTRLRENFDPGTVSHYFEQSQGHINNLRILLPDLFGDFQAIEIHATVQMSHGPNEVRPNFYSRKQLERLARDIDQIFEIRANCELQQPVKERPRRVFVTHGRTHDWLAVKDYIESDVQLKTAELAQQPNMGRTVIEKLIDTADGCDSAVIVMTGDDVDDQGDVRVRENVMHEIGFFQGRYGRDRVILLHEDNVNIPTNLSGVVYSPFPKGRVDVCFHLLMRELKAMYKL